VPSGFNPTYAGEGITVLSIATLFSLGFTWGDIWVAVQVAYLSCVTNVLLTNGGGQHIHSHESGSCLQTIFFVMLENFPLNITEIGHKSQLPSLYYPCQGTAGFAFCMRTISHLFKQSYMLTLWSQVVKKDIL